MPTEHVTAASGELFTVRLEAAGSAGYRWEVQTLPTEIRRDEQPADQSSGQRRPGDTTTQQFSFRGSKSGEYTITFIYKRPWEAEIESTHTARVTIR
jgi:predicted secreted protein